jgi:hypoxanthine phosphoribosyltransferase
MGRHRAWQDLGNLSFSARGSREVARFETDFKGQRMTERPYVIDRMISAKQIAARIEQLCGDIRRDFADSEKIVVVGLLRGSFIFIADLVRELDAVVEVDFIEASSYGDGMESSREVRILKDLRSGIEGRDVLVVEDIVDTGHTLDHVMRLLAGRKPKRLRSIALLDKPSRREVDFRADWIGFEIPDEFVVGYGIDFAQRDRNLPHIGKVRFIDTPAQPALSEA